MKQYLHFQVVAATVILLVFSACTKEADPDGPLYSQNDARRQILQVVAASVATGFNLLFSEMYSGYVV